MPAKQNDKINGKYGLRVVYVPSESDGGNMTTQIIILFLCVCRAQCHNNRCLVTIKCVLAPQCVAFIMVAIVTREPLHTMTMAHYSVVFVVVIVVHVRLICASP